MGIFEYEFKWSSKTKLSWPNHWPHSESAMFVNVKIAFLGIVEQFMAFHNPCLFSCPYQHPGNRDLASNSERPKTCSVELAQIKAKSLVDLY